MDTLPRPVRLSNTIRTPRHRASLGGRIDFAMFFRRRYVRGALELARAMTNPSLHFSTYLERDPACHPAYED